MKNDGFALVDALVWLFVICIFATIAIVMGRKALSTSLVDADEVSDNEIYLAAERYIENSDLISTSEYVCVSTNTLTSAGYLRNSLGKTRFVEAKVNNLTRVVEEMYFVKTC